MGTCHSKVFKREVSVYFNILWVLLKLPWVLEDFVHVSNLLFLRWYSEWSGDEQEVSKGRKKEGNDTFQVCSLMMFKRR
jgi:hypothetical protein